MTAIPTGVTAITGGHQLKGASNGKAQTRSSHRTDQGERLAEANSPGPTAYRVDCPALPQRRRLERIYPFRPPGPAGHEIGIRPCPHLDPHQRTIVPVTPKPHIAHPPAANRSQFELEPTQRRSPVTTKPADTTTQDSVPSTTLNDFQQLRQQVELLEREIQKLRTAAESADTGPQRRRLPPTRSSVTHKFRIGGHEGYLTVGLYDDQQPGELFLTMSKEGSTIGGLMDTVGILTSLALQYGVPLEALVHKFERVNFEPSGWTGDPIMRRASSVIDYVFRWLGMRFCETYRQNKLPSDESASIAPEHDSSRQPSACSLPDS